MKNKSEKYYKIGEVANMLGVHEDTLRNWDTQGLIVAERVGTRKDRRYTAEHIKKIKDEGLVSNLAKRQSSNRDYSHYSKEQLIKELQILQKQKKYGLVWEDKPEEVAEMCKTQAAILKPVSKMNVVGKKDEQQHIMIEGDNYHALQVLNYTHKGKIDVIYIDPPYNTGNKSWKYNNDYIDKEDSFRHSKWLSFMEKRLRLAKNLLKDDGFIIVTVDDYEIGSLRMLMDDIFSEEGRLGLVTVMHNPGGRSDDLHFATCHEYALFYGSKEGLSITYDMQLTEDQKENFSFEDEISKYRLAPLRRSGSNSTPNERPNLFYPIYYHPLKKEIIFEEKKGFIKIIPLDSNGAKRVWRWSKERVNESKEKEIVIKKNKDEKFSIFTKDRIKSGRKPKTVWADPKYAASSHGTILLKNILGKRGAFDYPKSIYAVKDMLEIGVQEKKQALILDFFSGSGTTGHAVMELNKEDGGNRQFILCTNNENNNGNGHGGIAENVCQPRIKKIMKGYKKNGNEAKVEGLGGNLEYLKTEFVDVENIGDVPDKKRLKFTHEAGYVIALKENAFKELEKNEWYQIFTDGRDRFVGIYFRENLEKLGDLEQKILNKKEVKLYIFSHGGSSDWVGDYEEYGNVLVKDIPEPILKVYRSLNS